MTERSRWLLLVLSLIIAWTGGLGLAYALIAHNERQAQRDLCELVQVYADEYRANPPTTETGRGIAESTYRYLERRC
jgi:hypothetical protein